MSILQRAIFQAAKRRAMDIEENVRIERKMPGDYDMCPECHRVVESKELKIYKPLREYICAKCRKKILKR